VPEKSEQKLKLTWKNHPLSQSGSNTVLPGVLTLTQQALVVASWPSGGPAGPVFWLVEDEWQLKLAQEALKLWGEQLAGSWLADGDRIAVWPAVQPPRPVVLHRLVLNEPAIILTTIAALTGKAMHPESFRSSVVTVHAGARMRPADLLDRLIPQGFSRATLADQPGLVAVRGGTVDVWLEKLNLAARIEFSAKSVERISLVGADGKLEAVSYYLQVEQTAE
jgi:transcription-repair coupling factor (superfamily II helicase)